MKPDLTSAARAFGHWRHFFRSRDAALRRADQPAPRRADADTEYAPTEWAETEWPSTDIQPAAPAGAGLSGR